MTQVSPHMQMFGMDIANDPEALGGPDVENDDSLLMEGIKDVPRGIAGGVIGFGQSLGDLADTGLEQIGIDIADDSMWSKQARPEWAQTKTIFGGVVEGMTQAALAFVPVAGIAGKASQALRGTQLISRAIETGGLTARAASILTSRGLVGGAIVDAYAFKGDEGHFADLMVSLGGPGDNAVTRWLSSQDDDTWLEGRAKNVVEGALLGIGWDAVVEPLMKAFKGKPDWDSNALFQDPKVSAERGLIPPKLAEELSGASWEPLVVKYDGQARRGFEEQLRAAVGDDDVTSTAMTLTDAYVKLVSESRGVSADEAYSGLFAGVNASAADGVRGATSFAEDGRALISLMRGSDASTVVHELGHVFRKNLNTISEDLAKQADEWVGAKPGSRWSRDQEEQWTTAFEKYLSDGQAPTPELTGVFEKFSKWIKTVYAGIIGSPLGASVSPQIRNVFDAMLGNGWNRFDPSASRPLEIPSNRPMQVLRDLRGTQPTRYVDVDAEDLARARQPRVTGGFLHTEAYKAFDAELPLAYDKIKQAGIEVVPWTKNTPPYESVQALQADISTNKRVFVPNGDPLTAVRMVFGHAADGYRFDDRGIENSYRALEGMFSEQARPALAGQVRGTALGAPSGPRGIVTLYQDPKEVLGTFEKALKANDDPMAAGIDTISYHVNHGRFEMKNSSRAVLEVADKVSEEMLNRKIGDVKTQAQVLSEAQELVKNPDALIKDAETLAKAIGNMDSMKIALDLSVASASDQLATGVRNLNELVKAGGEQALTVANANDLYDLMDTLWRFSTASGTIQKTAARTTAAGNIKIDLDGQSYDLSELGKGNPDRATLIDAATKVAEKEGLPSEAVKDWIKEPGNPRKPSSSPTIDSGARSDTGGGPTRAPEDVPVNESNGDSVVDPKNRPVIPDRGAPEFDFTPEAKKKFIKLLEELSMAVSTNQTGKTLDRMKKAHRAGVFSAFMEVHKASLLSGIPTLVLNVTSPAYQAMAQPVAKILGSLVQMNPAGAKEGTRLLFNTVGSLFDVVHATFNAPDGPGSKGLKPSFNIFNTEKPGLTGASGVSEHRHVITAENFGVDPTTVRGRVLNKVGRFVRLPFTASAVAEDMWNQVTYLAYVKTKAAMEADRIWDDASLSNDIKPALVAEYIQQRVSGAFDEFGRAVVGNDGLFKHDDAIRYAKSVNFTTELGKGTIGDSLMGMKAKHPSLDLVIPFLRVPLNLTRTAIRYTPLLGQLHDHMLSKHLSRNADEVARVKGEMVMGTALWGTAIYLASSGQITGGGPTNKAERDALLATGWRPYSLVSTDESGKTRYIEFRRFDPLATIYGLAADFSDMGQYLSDEDKDGLASVMVMALANNITSKTYLQGIADVSRALTGGTTTGSFLRSKAASLVPNIAARYASADDVYMREARTVLDAFKRRIPGFSDTLPPRRDILGSPMTPPPGYMPFVDTSRPGLANNVSQFASPVAMNTKTSDVVRLEMANLKHGFSPPPVKMNGVDLTLLKNRNGQDAYDRLMELTGEIKIGSKDVHAALDELVRSDYYKRLPAPDGRDDNDNARIRAMTKVLSRYRQAARLQVMREFPELKAAATGQGRPTLTSRDNPILQALNR